MRLWSFHPQYLDAKGLIAVWREGLLAQACLLGKTKGYTEHPQLLRFKQSFSPPQAIATYLSGVWEAATDRGYRFNRDKIETKPTTGVQLDVQDGQIRYEWAHFLKKIATRDPNRFETLKSETQPILHPIFRLKPGGIESWEKV